MRNRKIAALFSLLLILFTLACTIPFDFITPSEAEEKIVYIEITSTPEDEDSTSEVEDDDEEVSPTPPVAINLDGPWTIWYGSDEEELSIDFLQQGYELVGNAAVGDGHSILFKGDIAQDNESVSGVWENTNGNSGNFVIELDDSLSSFSGNLGGGVPFCGNRQENIKPSPCLE